jgi:hypothetical protein
MQTTKYLATDLVYMFLKNRIKFLLIFCTTFLLLSCGENRYDNIERNQQIEQKVAAKIVAAREKAVRECNDRLTQMAHLRADSIVAQKEMIGNAQANKNSQQIDALTAERRKPLSASQLRALQKKGEINLTLKPETSLKKIKDSTSE